MNNTIAPITLMLLYFAGLKYVGNVQKRIPTHKHAEIFWCLIAFISIGVLPSLLIKLQIIEKTFLSISVAFAYFFTFVCVCTYKALKKQQK